MRKRIAFITARFPYPLTKGDKLRAWYQIRDLSATADVHLISLSEHEPSETDFAALAPYCASINNFVLGKGKRYLRILRDLPSNRPFSVSYFFNAAIDRKIARVLNEIKPDLVHCHLIRTAPYARSLPAVGKTIDFMDCFSLGAWRELKASRNRFRKLFLRIEHQRLLRCERETFAAFDQHYIIADSDRAALPVDNPAAVTVVPNGVDFKRFHPKQVTKEFELLFSGHMGYVPNIAAAKFAITAVAPLLPASIKLLIAGVGVTPEIERLQSQQIIVQEHFSDIREAFWKSSILLAPMNISIGLQNKILQAMAMKIPVVCTAQANASIHAPVGKAILIASEPEEFKKAILRLLNEPDFYQQVTEQAYDFVHANFDWKTINAGLGKTMLGA